MGDLAIRSCVGWLCLGGTWTLLIIREALTGTTRFMTVSRRLPGLARTLLSARLQPLIALGVFDTIPISDTSRYREYVLTERGPRLFPVVTALRQWGTGYLFDQSEPQIVLWGRDSTSE